LGVMKPAPLDILKAKKITYMHSEHSDTTGNEISRENLFLLFIYTTLIKTIF